MTRPLLPFTAQELAYLATGARMLAHQARTDADKQSNPTVRETFESAERIYRELAAKCDRLASL
jgi:hypothetical protein